MSDPHLNPDDEVRQIVIHPAIWEPVVELIETRFPNVKIVLAPQELQGEDDIPTYFMTLKES